MTIALGRGDREKLPARRAASVISFEHEGVQYTAHIGRRVFADSAGNIYGDGSICEIFLAASKWNSAISLLASEAAMLASMLLQSGVAIDKIRELLSDARLGYAPGPVGTLLDLLAAEGWQVPAAPEAAAEPFDRADLYLRDAMARLEGKNLDGSPRRQAIAEKLQ